MFDFRRLVLAVIVLAIAIPMASAQEGPDNLPFNCRVTSTPPLVRLEGVAELAGDILISCSGIVPNQGDVPGGKRDLRGNVTLRADVPATSQWTGKTDLNSRLETDALLINSGNQGACADEFNCTPSERDPLSRVNANAVATGQIGQGVPYTGGSTVWAFPHVAGPTNHGWWTPQDGLGATLEWDNVLLAPGSAAGKQWYMQLRVTNVRVNASSYLGLADFAPAINAVVTINTQPGNVTATPDTVIIARPRPSFRVESTTTTRRNCDDPKRLRMELRIIELLPNAFRPRIDSEVNTGTTAADQDNPNTAFFTESGLMLDNYWKGSAPNTGNTGVATQGTQFNVSVISPNTLDATGYSLGVGAGSDTQAGSGLTSTAGLPIGTSTSGNDVIRDFRIEISDFAITVDPFLTNVLRVPITANYDEKLFGSTTVQVWYLPLSNAASGSSTNTSDNAVPRFVKTAKETEGFTVTRCRTLLLFPYVTNRNGYNTGIAIANTSRDDNPGPFANGGGAQPQTGPCTLYTYGGNNGSSNPVSQLPVESNIAVPAGGMYLMTLQTGGQVLGPAGENVGPVGAASGFEGYIIASCEFQYAHGYAFISDVNVQKVAQGYLALIIPDRVGFREEGGDDGYGDRPATPFNLGRGAFNGGEQLVH